MNDGGVCAIKNLAIIYHFASGSLYVRDLRNVVLLFLFEFFFLLCTQTRVKKRNVRNEKVVTLVVYYTLHIERVDINFLFSINIHSFTGFLHPSDKWIRPRLYSSFFFFC